VAITKALRWREREREREKKREIERERREREREREIFLELKRERSSWMSVLNIHTRCEKKGNTTQPILARRAADVAKGKKGFSVKKLKLHFVMNAAASGGILRQL
jgi:hypothetical protein